MTRATAVRLGIPTGALSRLILVPVGVFLLAIAFALSFWQYERVQARMYQEQRAAVRTVFEINQSVHNGSGGLAAMARNRGFERVWVLSATGDILDSNRRQEIGTQLDDLWWSALKDMPSGLKQTSVRFGNQNLEVLSLNSVELGRQVAIVSKPVNIWPVWSLNVGFILLMGLILWSTVAGLLILHLRRRIERPSHALDDRALELVRGGSVTEAQLDRIHAETAGSLGGHADCMVDMARKLQEQAASARQSSSRLSVLFNSIPSPAFILDQKQRLVDTNEALAEAMNVDPAWLRGRGLAVLADWMPVNRLKRWLDHSTTAAFGIRRMRWARHDGSEEATDTARFEECLLTIAPVPLDSGTGHLVLVEQVLESVAEPEATESIVDLDIVADDLVSGDGQAVAVPEVAPSISVDWADTVMQTSGMVAIAFNEDAETVYWSTGARALTGLSQQDIPDLITFTDRVFPHEKERTLFKQWLDAEPEDRSQELRMRTSDAIISTVWRAGEWRQKSMGDIGLLWTRVDPSLIERARFSGEEKGEPSVASDDS